VSGPPARLLAVGLSHKTAPVRTREKAALSPERSAALLHDLRTQDADECAALSTCNRTEVYAAVGEPNAAEEQLRRALVRHTELDAAAWRGSSYSHQDTEATRHLFRVAAGLDSMILGESEILGQVRAAAGTAAALGVSGPLLDRLFRAARQAARRVRRQTAIGAGAVSVSSVAVSLVCEAFTELAGRRVLLIGTGAMGEATAGALLGRGLSTLVVANRNLRSAQKLAARFGATPVPLAEIRGELRRADVVIAATASPCWFLSRRDVERALRGRTARPLVMVDTAVPRDLEPGIRDLPGVTLFDIDDLEERSNENLWHRRREARHAERIIADEVRRFGAELRPCEGDRAGHARPCPSRRWSGRDVGGVPARASDFVSTAG
jgi:glutamyl-tRNA reductase